MLFCGRAEHIVKTFTAATFGAIVTDPPIGTLRPDAYFDFFEEREMFRLLRAGGKIIAMTSPHHAVVELRPPRHFTIEARPELVPAATAVHPHERPLEPVKRLIETTEGEILDPYAGSGTTLVAAYELGRQAIGIEVDEKYCLAAALRLKLSEGGQ